MFFVHSRHIQSVLHVKSRHKCDSVCMAMYMLVSYLHFWTCFLHSRLQPVATRRRDELSVDPRRQGRHSTDASCSVKTSAAHTQSCSVPQICVQWFPCNTVFKNVSFQFAQLEANTLLLMQTLLHLFIEDNRGLFHHAFTIMYKVLIYYYYYYYYYCCW